MLQAHGRYPWVDKRLLLIPGLLLIVGAAILGTRLWPVTPHGGLSQAAAIQIAQAHVDKGAVDVTSAEVRENFNTGFDLPIHRWAWVITFRGQWHLLCAGGCDPTSEWVAIDYYSGEWIASQFSYPQRR